MTDNFLKKLVYKINVAKALALPVLSVIFLINDSFGFSKSETSPAGVVKPETEARGYSSDRTEKASLIFENNPDKADIAKSTEPAEQKINITGIIESRIGQTDATINWKTNIATTGQIDYGTTSDYGNLSSFTVESGFNHAITIAGLLPNTLYHYRIKLPATDGEIFSAGSTFTTSAKPGNDDLLYGICIGYMDILFDIVGNDVTIPPASEKVLTQLKKDGFSRLRMMEPFARGFMHHFPELPVQAIKLLQDRGFEVLLAINGSPFINGNIESKDKWVYRYFPGDDKIGKDDDGGLEEHKKRLTKFMDALKDGNLIAGMQFQLFDEPNAKSYFWGTFPQFEQLLKVNIEIITQPKYGIAKNNILCCAFTSNLVLNRKNEGPDNKNPYFDFIKSYQSNPLVNQFPFSFHWYPVGGISPKSPNFKPTDMKISPIPGSYITEMNVTSYMTKDHLMGNSTYPGYRSRNMFKEKVEEIITFAKTNHFAGIYFFNIKTKVDDPNEKNRISTGLFNSKGCPRKEYKDLLEILKRPVDFGPCGVPKEKEVF